jgi:magnesium transporter
MDAFGSVVNNNLNMIMKFLTAITIILSIPMVIAGFWGMNTEVPFEGALWGFLVVVGVSLLGSAVTMFFLIKKKML